MIENVEIVEDELDIATIMNSHFINITKKLKLKEDNTKSLENINDILNHYGNHKSILKIKENNKDLTTFKFSTISLAEMRREINSLDMNKASISDDIPASILKDSCDIYIVKLTDICNNCITQNIFPDSLKYAEVTPIFKKSDKANKENYRPISILSKLSKVFERILHKQISNYMENKFSKFLCGFR